MGYLLLMNRHMKYGDFVNKFMPYSASNQNSQLCSYKTINKMLRNITRGNDKNNLKPFGKLTILIENLRHSFYTVHRCG